MSDVGGTESLGELEIDVSLNTTAAQQQAQQLMGNMQQTGAAASGVAVSGFRAFGSAGVSAIGSVITQASNLNRAFGTTSPLAPLATGLSSIQGPLNTFGAALDQDTQKMNAMKLAATGLMTVGAVFVGLAGAVTQVSAPLQDANAALANSISNTKNSISGLPDDISNYTQQIKQADDTSAKFGYSADAVNQALSQLTEETKSAPEAFSELTFTETVAAASHTNLANAASLVGRMHAGLFRSLRQFGIDIPSMLSNPAKDATKAENELAKATDQLQSSQQNLANFQAKLSQAETDRQTKFQNAVTSATTAASTAEQTYQDSLQKTALAEQTAADASQKAQQTISDNAAKLAQDTQNAATKVSDAQGKIQSLQDQWAAQDEARATAAQDKIQQTANALEAAQEGLASASDAWSEAPAKTAREQLAKLDSMRKAAEALEKAQLAAQVAQQARAQGVPQATQDTRNQQMVAAQKALNDALQKQSQLGEEAAKMQLQNQAATLTAAKAQEAYALAQQHQADSQAKAAAAENKLAEAQQKLATAGDPTLAEQQQLSKLQDKVTEANEAMKKAKDDQTAAGQEQQKLDAQFSNAESQFMAREKGLLDRRSQTWAGHLRDWGATIKNSVMDLGGLAGPLATAGLAATGIGSFIRMGQSIKDTLKKIGGGEEGKNAKDTLDGVAKSIGKIEEETQAGSTGGGGLGQLAMDFEGLGSKSGKGAEEVKTATEKISTIGSDLSKAQGAASGAEKAMGEAGSFGRIGASIAGLVGKVGPAMSGVGSAIAGLGPMLIGPVGIVVGIIAGIAVVGWLIYKNWGTISSALSGAWNWMFGEGKRLFGDFEGFIKQWGVYILLPFAPFIALPIIIFKNWGTITGFFKGLLGDVSKLFTGFVAGIEWFMGTAIDDFLSIGGDIVNGLWKGISSAGSWLYNQVKNFAKGFIENPIKDVLSIFSPSRVMAQHGENIAKGLVQGMLAGSQDVKNASTRLANAASSGFTGPGGAGLPGAGVAPPMRPAQINANFQVTIPVQGSVVTETDLKNGIKTYLQDGALRNGGLSRFLGVPNSST